MTTRISALSVKNLRNGSVGVQDVVTPALVTRAAGDVLSGESEEVQEAVAGMWAMDTSTDVAQLLQTAIQQQRTRLMYAGCTKIKATVHNALSEEQQRMLEEMHPDFEIRYEYNASHDHGLGAEIRRFGTLLCKREFLPGAKYVDFGGSLMTHVHSGDKDCLTVGDVLDQKDPQRVTMERMQLNVLANSTAVVGRTDRHSADMARSVLAKEGKYFQSGRLETFSGKYRFGMMVHVYDVPMAAIPHMMERCGMELLVGVIHFSNQFYQSTSGELPTLGARYRIDRQADSFEMGFVNSGAKWYRHSWKAFQQYGANQVLHGSSKRYAYRIVERRGDTIKFRVLRVGGAALPETKQYYAQPTVDSVEVSTFRVPDTRAHTKVPLEPVVEVYPSGIWEKMLRTASVDAARGVLDYHALVDSYRTIVASDKFNGLETVSGTIDDARIANFVVFVASHAVAELSKLRVGLRTAVDMEMNARSVCDESTLALSLSTFAAVATAVVTAPLVPFLHGLTKLAGMGGKVMDQHLVSVRPMPRYVQVPVSVYDSRTYRTAEYRAAPSFVYGEELLRHADLDKFLADIAARLDGETETSKQQGKVTVNAEVVSESDTTTVVDDGPPAWLPLDLTYGPKSQEYSFDPGAHTMADMKAAIEEEINVIRMEAAELQSWMAMRYTDIMCVGSPRTGLLQRKRDEWKDMDAWYVECGVIVKSALGRSLSNFSYGGVYCDKPVDIADYSGVRVSSHMLPVDEVLWEGNGLDGKPIVRVHKVVSDAMSYTGWVLTNAQTTVFNGTQIIAGLQAALEAKFVFEHGVYRGGPGCGKTYSIVKSFSRGEFVTSPLVESVSDVRKMLVGEGKLPEGQAARVARTLDSVLCMRGRGGGEVPRGFPQASLLRCDEAYAARAARVYAVAALLGVRQLVCYGDSRQIQPVEYASVARVYDKVRLTHCIDNWIIHRAVPEVLAIFAHHYDFKLRTVNKSRKGILRVLRNPADYQPASDDFIIVSMYQAGKSTARKTYPKWVKHIHSTHESQGKSVDEVMLVQFDGRKRGNDDPFDLYQNARYLNVAFSRARYYVTYSTVGQEDKAMGWLEAAMNPRRVAACADLATVGKNVEFL